jgi:two-component sensor histidine kinase
MAMIDLATYAQNLVSHVFSSQNQSGLVQCRFELTPTILSIDQAIPSGLILNELITNALKYAYPKDSGGEIVVSLMNDEDCAVLMVSDQGVGLPPDLDLTQTLGLQLIDLLTQQLNGELNLESNQPGTRATIRFPKVL